MILGTVNAWMLWNAHWEHWSHMPPLEERTEYPYQNIRSKNFPWGDGDKTLLYVPLARDRTQMITYQAQSC